MNQKFIPVLWMQSAGHQAYLVGNQSRDLLLGGINTEPSDIDIATSALPTQILRILHHRKIIPSQVNHTFGVVAFKWEDGDYEITTFRQDIYDSRFDHIRRSPQQVILGTDIKTDAWRRDFTINAIYYNPKTGRFLDPVHGRADLKKKILRFIGNPEIRIKEDPIRVLRAVRFKYSLQLTYAPDTLLALAKWGHLVHKLSAASLKREFQKNNALPNVRLIRQELRSFGVITRF